MQTPASSNRFIPFTKSDMIEMCIQHLQLSDADVKEFREFCQILGALFHFEFHHRLEKLKACYGPFNPDADTRNVFQHSKAKRKNLQKQLDERIEKWFAQRWACHIDFEIGDAVKKLQRLNLIHKDGNVFKGLPLSHAKQQLDSIWDNFFEYHNNK